MAQNISRFLQINEKILLEYIINNDVNSTTPIYENGPAFLSIKSTQNDEVLYTELESHNNNGLNHLVVPIDNEHFNWFVPKRNNSLDVFISNNYIKNYSVYDIADELKIQYDTVRLHILSGYSFNDIYGFLLQIKTMNSEGEYSCISNWLYRRSDRGYTFNNEPIFLNDKIYDKYIDIKIPSSKILRGISNPSGSIKYLIDNFKFNNSNYIENVEIVYSNISADNVYETDNNDGFIFSLDDKLHINIPYDSPSDRFNLYIGESTVGNYIDFYATWDNIPITSDIVNAFNTKIYLYNSKNDYDYDAGYYDNVEIQERWLLKHEITTHFCNDEGIDVMVPQSYSLNQSFNTPYENDKFKYKPLFTGDDINLNNVTNIRFDYVARLINRYDGTQIVRNGSLAITNENGRLNRYVDNIVMLNENLFTHKIYNKIVRNDISVAGLSGINETKYVKIYYNASDIIVADNKNNQIDTIYLNSFGGIYLFNLKNSTDKSFIDLNNLSSYILCFRDSNNGIKQIECTYSDNMNLSLGQLEFNIPASVAVDMKKVKDADRLMSIMVKNLTGETSTIVELHYTFR